MEKPILWWKITQHLYQKASGTKRYSPKSNAGYTLLELLIVVIIIGVIAALMGPSWLAFTNQRRVNAANDVVLRALQEAQSKAKNTKLSYSVAFKIPTTPQAGVPEIAIYRTKKADGSYVNPDTEIASSIWRSLGQDLAIKPGQIILQTNLTRENNGSSLSENKIITFDYMGALPTGSQVTETTPLTVTVAIPAGNNPNKSTQRCVKVTTLLGAMTIGRGEYNASSNPGGCP